MYGDELPNPQAVDTVSELLDDPRCFMSEYDGTVVSLASLNYIQVAMAYTGCHDPNANLARTRVPDLQVVSHEEPLTLQNRSSHWCPSLNRLLG
jgi:hypothetical protein